MQAEMGLNAASVHVRIGDEPEDHRTVVSAIGRALFAAGYNEAPNARTADRTLIVHPASSGPWLTIFDSEIDGLDDIAAALSRETSADAICTSIEQSDAMRLAWFRLGLQIDALTAQGRKGDGSPELWTPLLASDATPELFRDALERHAIFAEDKLAALAGLLGLNRDLCLAHVEELLDAPGRPVGVRLHFRRQALATA